VLVVPRYDLGRGVRLDSCTAMCSQPPSFTQQKTYDTLVLGCYMPAAALLSTTDNQFEHRLMGHNLELGSSKVDATMPKLQPRVNVKECIT
jgi:hypothetical protein